MVLLVPLWHTSMLHHHNVDAGFGRFQPQPQLLPDGRKEIGEDFVGCAIDPHNGRALKLIRRPGKREVEFRRQPGLIDHRSVQHGRL